MDLLGLAGGSVGGLLSGAAGKLLSNALSGWLESRRMKAQLEADQARRAANERAEIREQALRGAEREVTSQSWLGFRLFGLWWGVQRERMYADTYYNAVSASRSLLFTLIVSVYAFTMLWWTIHPEIPILTFAVDQVPETKSWLFGAYKRVSNEMEAYVITSGSLAFQNLPVVTAIIGFFAVPGHQTRRRL